MENLKEREYLLTNNNIQLSGFTERSINRLVNTKQTPSILNIETNHIKRDFKKDNRNVVPLLEYQLWLEAGKLDKANFKSVNGDDKVNFNSNMWRNFRNTVGLYSDRKNNSTESIATLYPINIPAPSQIGSNTLKRYYEQNKNLFKSDKSYNLALEKVDKEATLMKYLRLKSEMRNPPLDWNGNILPPKNFRKYPPVNKKNILQSVENDNKHLPHLNQTLGKKFEPLESLILNEQIKLEQSNKIKTKKVMPTKLVYRQNHPDFNKVIIEQQIKGIQNSFSAKNSEVL